MTNPHSPARDLAQRMKALEAVTRTHLPAKTITVLRVDGKAFGTYTRHLTKPFDARFLADMTATALGMAQRISGTFAAYVQSDEISVLLSDQASPTTQPWLGGNHNKIVSVSASLATGLFNARRADLHTHPDGHLGDPALFDSRAFTVSPDDAAAYLRWRQADARRNALAMLCDDVLGKRATVSAGTQERWRLLAEHGRTPDTLDPGVLNGRLLRPVTEITDVTYTDKRTGLQCVASAVERRRWLVEPAPDFARQGRDTLIPHTLDGEDATARLVKTEGTRCASPTSPPSPQTTAGTTTPPGPAPTSAPNTPRASTGTSST